MVVKFLHVALLLPLQDAMNAGSRGSIVIANAALGMTTSFAALKKAELAAHDADRPQYAVAGWLARVGCAVEIRGGDLRQHDAESND